MLRLVLAVALAASLVAVATPAVEDARTTRTERLAERELGRVATAANALAREEDPGARRTLRVSLPEGSPTEAPLAFVALGGVPGEESAVDATGRDVLAFRVAGGRQRLVRTAADLRVHRTDADPAAASDSRPLVLEDGGTYRLTLRLVRLDGELSVVVSAKDA